MATWYVAHWAIGLGIGPRVASSPKPNHLVRVRGSYASN